MSSVKGLSHSHPTSNISFVFDFCAGPRRPATPIYAHHITLPVCSLLGYWTSADRTWSRGGGANIQRTHGRFWRESYTRYLSVCFNRIVHCVSLEIYCKLCMLVIYRKFIGYRLLCSKGTSMGEFFHSGPRFFSYACLARFVDSPHSVHVHACARRGAHVC